MMRKTIPHSYMKENLKEQMMILTARNQKLFLTSFLILMRMIMNLMVILQNLLI